MKDWLTQLWRLRRLSLFPLPQAGGLDSLVEELKVLRASRLMISIQVWRPDNQEHLSSRRSMTQPISQVENEGNLTLSFHSFWLSHSERPLLGLGQCGPLSRGVVENTDGGSLFWGACKMRHSEEHARMKEMCHSQVPEKLGAKGKLVIIPEVAWDSARE